MKTGKGFTELKKALMEIDYQTRTEPVMHPKGHVELSAEMQDGQLKDWMVREGPDSLKSGANYYGVRYGSLEQCLDAVNKESLISDNYEVLCLISSGTAKEWNPIRMCTTVSSQWLDVSPYAPFDVSAETVRFPHIKIALTEAELKDCLSTGLALYSTINDMLYPIKPCALLSVGKLVGCAGAFTDLDKVSGVHLGEALMLAERFSKLKYAKLIYRDMNRGHGEFETVRPLIGVSRADYTVIPNMAVVDAVQAEIDRFFVSRLDQWTVSEEAIDVRFSASRMNGTGPTAYFRLINSNIPGTGIRLYAGLLLSGIEVCAIKTSAFHDAKFLSADGAKKLVRRAAAETARLSDSCSSMSGFKVSLASDSLDGIKTVIGKKRAKEKAKDLANIHSGNASDVFAQVLKASYCELPEKQAYELSREYAKLAEKLVSESRKETLS